MEQVDRTSYFKGVPVQADVNMIRREFQEKDLSPGMIIKYEEIEKIIKRDRKSARFKSVTSAWRKQVEKLTNMIIGARDGKEFYVMQESEKVDLGGKKINMAKNMAKRSYVVCSLVNQSELSEEDRDKLNYHSIVSAQIISTAQRRSPTALPTI